MQRLSSASRVPKDYIIDLEKLQEEEEAMVKPRRWFSSRKTQSLSLKLIHILPLIVLLCLFILWYLSYPVNLEIKDGRLTKINRIEMSRSLNETRVDLVAILAKATSPNVSVSDMLIPNTATSPQPATRMD